MEEQLITFETAVLAKEKGLNQNPYIIKYAYVPTYVDGSAVCLGNSLFSPENNVAVAPTQSLLQRWLREEHNISIIIPYACGYTICFNLITRDGLCEYPNLKHYDTYEEALEVGLREALKLIKL